jgi:hypothetical protein
LLHNGRAGHAAFPPLAAGVLVVAGGLEGDAGEGVDEGVEDEQFGLELAGLGDGLRLLVTIEPLEHIAGGGDLGPWPGADIGPDDASADATDAVVVTPAVATRFPGHCPPPKRRNCGLVAQRADC